MLHHILCSESWKSCLRVEIRGEMLLTRLFPHKRIMPRSKYAREMDAVVLKCRNLQALYKDLQILIDIKLNVLIVLLGH